MGKHDRLSFISLGLNFERHLFSFSLFGFLLVYYQSIFISKLFIEIFKSTEKHYEAGGKMTTVNIWVYFFVIVLCDFCLHVIGNIVFSSLDSLLLYA